MCFLRLYWLSTFCLPPVTHAQDGDVGEVGGDQIGAAEAPEAIVIIDTHLASAIRATSA